MKSKILIACASALFVVNFCHAERIINWRRDNGGRNGYKKVNQTYVGTTTQGNDQIYNITCEDPGLEACKFASIANPTTLDDWAVNTASRFFDEMHDDIDVASATSSNGTWSKTIQGVFMDKPVKIYISTSWSKSLSGVTDIKTIINPVYL